MHRVMVVPHHAYVKDILLLFSGSGKTVGLAVGLTFLFLAILAIAGIIVFLHIRSEYTVTSAMFS